MRKLLCFFGWHQMWFKSTWKPNIHADIVTDSIMEGGCHHCDRKNHYRHLVWDGRDMVEKNYAEN